MKELVVALVILIIIGLIGRHSVNELGISEYILGIIVILVIMYFSNKLPPPNPTP